VALIFSIDTERPPLGVFGLGHEPHALSDVRRPDTCSRQTCRPAGVTFSLQVIENSVEPPVGNRALNLFAKDRDRATLADEPRPMRPEMSIVGAALLLPGG
jgi:hypothetical protein